LQRLKGEKRLRTKSIKRKHKNKAAFFHKQTLAAESLVVNLLNFFFNQAAALLLLATMLK